MSNNLPVLREAAVEGLKLVTDMLTTDGKFSVADMLNVLAFQFIFLMNYQKEGRDLENARILLDKHKSGVLDALERNGWK